MLRQTEFAQRVLENLTTTALLLDSSLRLTFINPAGEMLFEISARQSHAVPLADLLPGAEAFIDNLVEAVQTGRPYTERELKLSLPVDREITVDCSVTPLIEPHHEPALLIEMIQIDRHLRIAREEHLLTQHQAARTLVRGLAHEIKNPLGGLRGAAQLLERELPEESLKEYTRIIIHEADRLQVLMDRMLGPNSLPQRRRLNIHEVLEHVRNLVQAEASPGIQLIRDYDPSLPELNADSVMLIQAVLNIVRNAVQALGKEGKITLSTRTLRQQNIGQMRFKLVARIDVIDNGPGIEPDMLEQVFYPMVTSRAEGTGLGLSIAQSLVNQHGGLIECESRPGRTVFTLLLPLESVDE